MPYDRRGCKNPRWKGGRRIRPDGYVDCYAPGHPFAYRNRVLEHRLVMEKHLGRYLQPHEIVHHKNENPSDNRLDNLELTNRVDHGRHHNCGKKHKDRWEPRVDKAAIIRLYQTEQLTLRETAESVGVSYGSLRYHCIRYGIPIRRTDPWHKRRMEKHHANSRSRSSSTNGRNCPTGSKDLSRTKNKVAAP